MTPPPLARGPGIILPHFTRAIVTRSLATWLIVRIAMIVVARGLPEPAGAAASPLRISPFAALYVAGIVAAVGWVGARISNEDTFLLCLGYSRRRQLAMHAAPALLVELVIWLAVRR